MSIGYQRAVVWIPNPRGSSEAKSSTCDMELEIKQFLCLLEQTEDIDPTVPVVK